MEEKEKTYIFDNPRNVKLLIYGLVVLCAVLFLLDFFIHRHIEHSLQSWFGFYGVYGFVCCLFLVLAAKQTRKIVRRKDDYYDE